MGKVYTKLRDGFTLVELLVVIAIIALLAGILVPSLTKAMDLGRSGACMNNLHSMGVALRMYLNQSNDIMPEVAAMPSEVASTCPRLADVIAPYIDHAEALKCPGDRERTYFETEGSSYDFNTMLGGRTVLNSFLSKHWGEENVHVLYDYENTFHGNWMNFLFADGHVSNDNTE